MFRMPTTSFFIDKSRMISDQYQGLSRLYMQQFSGKKLLFASDDPVLAAQITSTQDYIDQLNAYKQNEINAANRVQLFDSSAKQSVSTIDQIKQLIKSAQNDTITDEQRQAIAGQLKGCLTTLFNSVNLRDSDGAYIYSGNATSTPPYVKQGSRYQYQGSQNTTSIDIGPGVATTYNESGYTVFDDIYQGNGAFTIRSSPSNVGTAAATPGSVVNASTYIRDTYTVNFLTNGAGEMVYSVIGAASGQVIPPLPGTIPLNSPLYVAGTDITFNGMSLSINGAPQAGDTFQIAPSQKDNVFNSLENLINILTISTDGDPVKLAAFHTAINQSAATFDQIFSHMINYRSEVGTATQLVQNQVQINASLRLDQSAIYDQLASAKPEETASQLKQSLLYLQLTQEAYTQIQATLMNLFKM